MLHEILFALLGKTGDIIQLTMDKYEANPQIDFISLPEREMVNKIVQLGYYFSRIEAFLEDNYKQFAQMGMQPLQPSVSNNPN